MRHFIKQHRSLFLFLLLAGLASFGAGGAWLGNQLQLGQYSVASTFPAASSTNLGSLVFDTDDAGVWVSDGVGWRPVGAGSNLPVTGGGNDFFVDGGISTVFGNTIWMRATHLLIGHEDGGIAFDGGEGYMLQNALLQVSVGNTSSSNLFLDAGAGLAMYSNRGGFNVNPLVNPGGLELSPLNSDMVLGHAAAAGFITSWWGWVGAIPYLDGSLVAGSNLNGNFVQGINWVMPTAARQSGQGRSMAWLDDAVTPNKIFQMSPSGTMDFFAGSTVNAIKLNTSNSRIDLGGGSTDHIYSDSVGVNTDSYFLANSSWGSAAGAGLRGDSVRITPVAFSSYTQANATALGSNAIVSETGTDTEWVTSQSAVLAPSATIAFKPLGMPNVVADRQTITTRITGTGRTAYPEIAEYIPCNTFGTAAAKVQMAYLNGGGTTVTQQTTFTFGARTYYSMIANDSTVIIQGFPVCSTTATTFHPLVYASQVTGSQVSLCQRVVGPTVISSGTIWWGLFSAAQTHAATNLPGNNGAGFRYRGGTDTNWQYCVGNGTTTTCTASTVAMTIGKEYLLCVYQTPSAVVWLINGVLVASQATSMGINGNASPYVAYDGPATAGSLYVGPMTVESL